jgi:hypothetical protein
LANDRIGVSTWSRAGDLIVGELSWLTATWLREHLLVLRSMAVEARGRSGLVESLSRGEDDHVAVARTRDNVDRVLATLDRERARVVITSVDERQMWMWTLVELGMSVAVRMGVPWEVVQRDPDTIEDHCDRLVSRLGRWLTGLAAELAGVPD